MTSRRITALSMATLGAVALAGLPGPAEAACTLATPCATLPVDIGQGASAAYGISADGATVVGISGTTAAAWLNGQLTLLGTLGGTTSRAYGVSGDGSVIVGYADYQGTGTYHAFRWQGGVMTDLGALGGAKSSATAVSRDGSIVVGWAEVNNIATRHAFVWQGGVMTDLGVLPGGTSMATSVSGDGSVIAGYASDSNGFVQAARWQGGTLTTLGTLGGTSSVAQAVSGDGAAIGGWSYIAGGVQHGFIWRNGVMNDIGNLGGNFGSVSALSEHGDIAVGTADVASATFHAFRWTRATGLRDLNTLLAAAGINMTGITLINASAITGDGRFIAGDGDFGAGQSAYVLYYDDGAAGLSTLASQQASLDGVASARRGAMSQQHGLAAPLLGTDKPFSTDTYVGAFGAAGSASAGVFAQGTHPIGLTLLAGFSYNRETYDSIALTRGYSGAAALRYTPRGEAALRPFVEGGGWITRGARLDTDRSYLNGAGTVTARSQSDADFSYVYARAGLVHDGGWGQLVGSLELGREWLATGSSAETASLNNPFVAVYAGATDVMNVAKLRLSYSRPLTPRLDMTLWSAAATSFGGRTDLRASVAGFGTLAARAPADAQWLEAGARFGYALTETVTVDAFAGGVTGNAGIGGRVHAGGDVRIRF
jgi:probable HAF family extracellular repeat protein